MLLKSVLAVLNEVPGLGPEQAGDEVHSESSVVHYASLGWVRGFRVVDGVEEGPMQRRGRLYGGKASSDHEILTARKIHTAETTVLVATLRLEAGGGRC